MSKAVTEITGKFWALVIAHHGGLGMGTLSGIDIGLRDNPFIGFCTYMRSLAIQHQFPLTGFISPRDAATVLVINGTTHTERHIKVLLSVDASVAQFFWRTTVKVTRLIARMEKSVACTESWPIHPSKVHAGPASNS